MASVAWRILPTTCRANSAVYAQQENPRLRLRRHFGEPLKAGFSDGRLSRAGDDGRVR